MGHKIILSDHYDIGRRPVYEDRCASAQFVTAGGLKLAVAIVADGVGGENRGERAAQLAIDATLNRVRNGLETDVPTLLTRAIETANQAVLDEVQRAGVDNMSTTISVAAILDGRVLYVANVGDSRVYLCRKTKLTQLTVDHTFATIMPWRGKMSPDEARMHPRAHALMRALGLREDMPVDIGFYVNTADPAVAEQRGGHGLPLEQGDSVLVCSDGLIKLARTGEPYAKPEEIVRVLRTQEGNKAARTLVAFAIGRDADDNVSVAVLQTYDPARRVRTNVMRGAVVGAIAVLVVALLFVLLRLMGTSGKLSKIEEQNTSTAYVVTYIAGVQAAYTKTPTPTATFTSTPYVPPEPGQIGNLYSYSADAGRRLNQRDSADPSQGQFLAVINQDKGSNASEYAYFYAQPNTLIEFTSASSNEIFLTFDHGDVFIQTGGFTQGVTLSLARTTVRLQVSGSCMAVTYMSPDTVSASCYEGQCAYSMTIGEPPRSLLQGNRVILDTRALTERIIEPVPSSEADRYREILLSWEDQNPNIQRCLVPNYASTPTPTITPSPIPPPPTRRPPTRPPTQPPLPTVGPYGAAPPDDVMVEHERARDSDSSAVLPVSVAMLVLFAGSTGIAVIKRTGRRN